MERNQPRVPSSERNVAAYASRAGERTGRSGTGSSDDAIIDFFSFSLSESSLFLVAQV
jgi:hypothetical protein